jgi:14-3-3 protein epsilon
MCYDMIGLLSRQLIPSAKVFQDQIYYLTLTADCYRYVCESCDESEKWEPTNSANEKYEQTVQMAKDHLATCNPLLLNAVLNFTVFTSQILGRREDAIREAKTAIDDAEAAAREDRKELLPEAEHIIAMMKKNIEMWQKQDQPP